MTGSGVLIYNAGSKFPAAGGSFGGITIGGKASVSLTPAASGTYAGIAVFQSRDNKSAISLSGQASLSCPNGVIYAPASPVNMASGTAQLTAALVAGQLKMGGSTHFAPTAPAAVDAVLCRPRRPDRPRRSRCRTARPADPLFAARCPSRLRSPPRLPRRRRMTSTGSQTNSSPGGWRVVRQIPAFISSTAQDYRSEEDSPRRHGGNGGYRTQRERHQNSWPRATSGLSLHGCIRTDKIIAVATRCQHWFYSPCPPCLRGESCAVELVSAAENNIWWDSLRSAHPTL